MVYFRWEVFISFKKNNGYYTKASQLLSNEAVNIRSSHSEVFLGKAVLKICSKFTEEHPCHCKVALIEITLRHGCSSVKLLHIFRTPLLKNTSGRLLLKYGICQLVFVFYRDVDIFPFLWQCFQVILASLNCLLLLQYFNFILA